MYFNMCIMSIVVVVTGIHDSWEKRRNKRAERKAIERELAQGPPIYPSRRIIIHDFPPDEEPESSDKKFEKFSLLPPELREMIWKYCLTIPRAEPRNGQMSWPPMLSICRESRGEAIRYYEGLLGHLDQFDLKAEGERARKEVEVSKRRDGWQEKQRRQDTS